MVGLCPRLARLRALLCGGVRDDRDSFAEKLAEMTADRDREARAADECHAERVAARTQLAEAKRLLQRALSMLAPVRYPPDNGHGLIAVDNEALGIVGEFVGQLRAFLSSPDAREESKAPPCFRCDGSGFEDARHSDEFCRECNGAGTFMHKASPTPATPKPARVLHRWDEEGDTCLTIPWREGEKMRAPCFACSGTSRASSGGAK